MGIISRTLTPKPVKKLRRATHPVGTVKFQAKKAVVPRGVHRALNPGEAIEADVARAVRGGSSRRGTSRSQTSLEVIVK
jgi:hypothetical protein